MSKLQDRGLPSAPFLTLNMIEELILAAQERHPTLREGQALMNKLYKLDLELYTEILGTNADCYYVDERIPAFWERIAKEQKCP